MADLGGLGAKEGVPVNYNWVLPNLIQPLLPWLVILGLLLLKPNRCGAAWWIVAPLAMVAALSQTILGASGWVPSSESEVFLGVITALTFGLAAVWLLAPFLARSHRFLSFLCLLPTLAIFSAVAFALRQDWSGGETMMVAQIMVFLALAVLVLSLALFLTGCLCRRRHRPVGSYLWFLLMLAGLWFVIVTPFFAFAMAASGGEVPWTAFGGVLMVVTGISFGVALPFLLLSSANGLFRDRLRRLLHVEQAASPPLIPPLPAPNPAM